MTSESLERPELGKSLLHNRNFILLWCAYAVSAMGDHLSEMAILKTQDALNTEVDITRLSARMTFIFFVPFFLLAPIAGLLADRLPRRGLMVFADLVRCVVMFLFAGLMAWTQDWGVWGPFLPLLLVGTFAAAFSPARSALLPTLIRPDQLVRANGLISGLGIIATMAAALVGGHLADHYRPSTAFRLDALTFTASAALLLFLRPPKQHTNSRRQGGLLAAAGQLQRGFRYVGTHRRVCELIAIAVIVWFCGALVNSVVPAVVRDVYHGTYTTISAYRALLGAGFIIGAAGMTVLGSALRSEIAMTWGLFGIAVGMGLFAASVFLPLPVDSLRLIGGVGIVMGGMFGLVAIASFNTLLQRIVADRYRGRIFGVKDLCTTGALLVATGSLAVPAWTHLDHWVGFILLAVALLTFIAGLVTMKARLRRSLHGRRLTLVKNLNEFIAKFWWRFQRVGRSTVPRSGPVIITSNHTCSADPLFLSAAVPYRGIAFMVAEEYTKWPIARQVMGLVECIPVKRDGRDATATKHAMRHLRAGKALGIFIEGGIVAPGEVPDPKNGVAMLALKTGAMVIPAYISGAIYHERIVRGLLSRHRARVRFGLPVDLSEFRKTGRNRETLRAATREIYAAIKALAPTEDDCCHVQDSTIPRNLSSEQT